MKTPVPLLAGLLLAATLGAAEAPRPIPAFKGDTRQYWMDVCARCHGTLGNGRDAGGRQLPDAGPDFTDGRKAHKRKDGDLVRTTLLGKEKMPAFKDKMTEQDVLRMIKEVIRPFSAR